MHASGIERELTYHHVCVSSRERLALLICIHCIRSRFGYSGTHSGLQRSCLVDRLKVYNRAISACWEL